jgi:hypothetical protein
MIAYRATKADEDLWHLDSAACFHMTPKKDIFSLYELSNDNISVADGKVLACVGIGAVTFS